MTRGFLERAHTFRKRRGGCINGPRLFDLRNENGADNGGVGEAAKNGNVAGKRDAEADGNGKLRDAARPPEEGREIGGQGILRAANLRAGDGIKTTGRASS